MRRKMTWLAAMAVVILIGSAAWGLSGNGFSGKQVYDLNHPRPATGFERAQRAVLGPVVQLILPVIYDERTRYAPGYQEEVFRSLKPGVGEEEARKLLGEPLSKRTLADGRRILYYSEQQTPTDNYLMRTLVFDGQGHLLERHSEFYVD
jgi:hypothetical protein